MTTLSDKEKNNRLVQLLLAQTPSKATSNTGLYQPQTYLPNAAYAVDDMINKAAIGANVSEPNTSSNIIDKATGGHGMRWDGSALKGDGFMGKIHDGYGPGGSTEISTGGSFDGKETEYPLMTPNQGFKDLNNIITGGKPTNKMYDLAMQHALSRLLTGRNAFAGIGDQKPYWEDK